MCDPLVEVFTSNSFPIDGFFTWFKRAEVKVLLHVKLCFRNASVACIFVVYCLSSSVHMHAALTICTSLINLIDCTVIITTSHYKDGSLRVFVVL